jgi:hypothetical protein
LVKGGGLEGARQQVPAPIGRPGRIEGFAIMDHMMGGAMMRGMSLLWRLVILVLLLASAVLVKYLFFSKGQ